MSTGTSSKLLWLKGSGKREAKDMRIESVGITAARKLVAGAEPGIS